jgi:hypothetical protein
MTNSIWQATIQNDSGDIISGAQIDVVDENTGLPALIYSSRAGAALTNPFFATAEGFAQFYAAAGEYRITATNTGTSEAQTWRYERLGDAGAKDTGTGATQVPTNADLPTFGTAAEADVQATPTDSAAGRLLNNETTEIGGFINYTGANLNPNVFGGIGANDRLISSRANGSTLIDFYVDVDYVNTPTLNSITSTFAIQDKGGNVINSGITSANISVNSLSSNKQLIIRVTGLTLTIGTDYVLVSETASSKIVVNT